MAELEIGFILAELARGFIPRAPTLARIRIPGSRYIREYNRALAELERGFMPRAPTLARRPTPVTIREYGLALARFERERMY